MKKLLLIIMIAIGATQANSQSITRIFGTSPFQDSLWTFDTTNFAVVRRLGPSWPGHTVTGMTSITKNPITNELFAIVKISGSPSNSRYLCKVNPYTAVLDSVGDLGDKFSSLTFSSDGVLFGATGNGASDPESFFRINHTTAVRTLITALGNGADGEVIAYNSDDNMIYHWSGNGTMVFEKFDTTGSVPVNIPTSGSSSGETFGAVYIGSGNFIISNISSQFKHVDTAGVYSAPIGLGAPDDIRGTALVTCPRLITGGAAFCAGDSSLLTMSTANAYQWILNGDTIVGATSQTYYAKQAGSYNCMVSDACGTDSLAATKNVVENALPIANITASSMALCAGISDTLVASATGGSGVYTNYTWTPGTHANNDTAYFIGLTGGIKNWKLKVTDNNGCVSLQDTAKVTVYALPNVTATSDATNDAVCEGSDITLTGAGADTYTWNNSVVDGAAFALTDTMDYIVTGVDANNCSNKDTITVYTLALPVILSQSGDVTICGEGSGNFTVTPAAGTYTYAWAYSSDLSSWSLINGFYGESNFTTANMTIDSLNNNGWDGYYIGAEVTGTNGCASYTPGAFITVNDLPTVVASSDATNDAVCLGSNVTLTGSGAVTYTWNNLVVDGAAFAPADTMDYIVTGVDANSCSNKDTITIYTLDLPTVTATSDAVNDAVCAGSDITLNGVGASSYTWDMSVVNGVAFTLNDTMDYTVTGADANGCVNTATITVYTYALPTVTATSDAANNTVCVGNDITLTGGGASSYSWDMSVVDGVAFTLNDTMDYTVTGTDANGCVNTATITAFADLCTGLKNTASNNVSVYPNPTKGNVTITTSSVANSIQIFDVVGKFITNVLVTNETTNIDLSNFANGVYVVRVKSNNSTQNIRIVKAN